MEKRKNLHDYGLALVVIGVLNLFSFVLTVVSGLVDGTINKALANVEADIIVAVKIVLCIIAALMGLLAVADALIGIKALKISKNPKADKGHITAAKVFAVISVISAISAVVTLFDGTAPIVDAIITLANSVLNVVVYVLFIKAAQAVRQDVLTGEK